MFFPLFPSFLLISLSMGAASAGAKLNAGWELVQGQALQYTDLDMFHVGPSKIHGRGVIASQAITKGTRIGLMWFDFLSDPPAAAESHTGFKHKRGYIPVQGDLGVHTVTLAEAKTKCQQQEACQGITFQAKELPLAEERVSVTFKDKSNVVANNNWHSFIKPGARSVSYYPITCNSEYFPALLPAYLSPDELNVCFPRMVNHNCDPSADVTWVEMEEEFGVPGLPMTQGRRVRAWYMRAGKDIAVGEELDLNYAVFPTYMSRQLDDKPIICPSVGKADGHNEL